MFDRLYDVTERVSVNFMGYVSERSRFDFAVIYTDHFFGKPLVVCMQTGRSSLLSLEDVNDLDYLQNVFRIKDRREVEELSLFFRQRLPDVGAKEQY